MLIQLNIQQNHGRALIHMNNSLKNEIDTLLFKYPQLSVNKTNNGYTICGPFILNHEYQGIYLYDKYEIKIEVSENYPYEIPCVWETSNNIPNDFGHWYSDNNALCLGAACDLFDFIDEHPSLSDYVDGLLTSYFYSATFYKKYGSVPYGERSHNIKGIIEAYLERYQTTDEKLLLKLLKYISGIHKYRGHIPCPCGSGKKFRNCHGKQILKDIQSDRYPIHKSYALCIIKYYIKRDENYG